MFGFKGTPTCFVIQEANGIVNGSNRDFATRHGSKYGNTYTRYLFDFEEVNPAKPNQQALLSTVLVSYGSATVKVPVGTQILSGGAQIGGINYTLNDAYVYTNTEIRYFRYNSNAVLSPATRKIKQILPYHETTVVQFAHILNSSPSSVMNNLTGTLELDMRQFPNLEAVDVHEAYINRVNYKFNNPKLIHFQLRETVALTGVTGKIPSTVTSICLAQCNLTGVTTLLEDAVNAKSLMFGLYSGLINVVAVATTTLRGVVDVSHMTNLKEFLLGQNTNVTSLILPTGKTDWSWIHIQLLSTSASNAFNVNLLNDFLSSPDLRVFMFIQNNILTSRNITHSEISDDLLAFYCYGNRWTGDVSITSSKPTLREFKIGLNQNETNRFDNINIIGLDGGNLRSLHIPGVLCSSLTLPSTLPSIQDLVLYDNELSISGNPNLITTINGFSSLTSLEFSNNVNTNGNTYVSQNGFTLGSNGVLSGLTNLSTLLMGDCGITGDWVLPANNTLTIIGIGFNTGLTSLINLEAQTGLQIFRANGCTSLDFEIGNTFTSLLDLRIVDTPVTSVVLSGKTSTGLLVAVIVDGTPITTLTMPRTELTGKFTNSHAFNGVGCTGLTTINNLEFVGYNSRNVHAQFQFNGCSLNTAIPFGSNNFVPTNILIQDNNISKSNIDAIISNVYTNRTKWSTFISSVNKQINMGGNNAPPTGIYQAPTGFVLGSNDGSPANAQEQLYVLVNNYSWTITFNEYETFTQAFVTAVSAEGVSLDTTTKQALQDFEVGAKAVGNLWTKLHAIYPMVGASGKSHKYNFKDPRNADDAYRLKFYNGTISTPLSDSDAIHTANGIEFDGIGKFADTHYVPSTSASLNSAHISVYIRTNSAFAGDDISVNDIDAGAGSRIVAKWDDGNSYNGLHGSIFNSVSNVDSRGYYIANRSGATSFTLFRNNTSIITNSNASVALPTVAYSLGGRRTKSGTVAVNNFSNKNQAFVTIGESLTTEEQTALHDLVVAFQTALGRNV